MRPSFFRAVGHCPAGQVRRGPLARQRGPVPAEERPGGRMEIRDGRALNYSVTAFFARRGDRTLQPPRRLFVGPLGRPLATAETNENAAASPAFFRLLHTLSAGLLAVM